MPARALALSEATEKVAAEFEFKIAEKAFFLALVVAMATKLDNETIGGLLIKAEEKIPRRILDAAIQRLDELIGNATT